MTRFRTWADGSVARLDADEHGLGIAVMDPDGQAAAVHVDGWRPLQSGYTAVRAYSRVPLVDGSMADSSLVLAALPTHPSDPNVVVEHFLDGSTRTTRFVDGGATHGGKTIEVFDDGQGTVTTTTTSADGTTSVRVDQTSDGVTHTTEQTSRPDGSKSESTGDHTSDGAGQSTTREIDSQGRVRSTTDVVDSVSGGQHTHTETTTLFTGEKDTHTEITAPDGSKYVENSHTDMSGQVTNRDTDYTWPGHEVETHLNPDGTTTVVSHETQQDLAGNQTHVIDTTQVIDASGAPTGDTQTHEVIVDYGDGSITVVDTVTHPDKSSDVTTTKTDSQGQTQVTTESHPPPAPDPGDGTDGTNGTNGTNGTPNGTNGKTNGTNGKTNGTDGTNGTDSPGPIAVGPDVIVGGGIDIGGHPCDPTASSECMPIVVRRPREVSGAIAPELAELLALSAQPGAGADDYVAAANRVAAALFADTSDAKAFDRGRSAPLTREVEQPASDGVYWDVGRMVPLLRSLAANGPSPAAR